MKLTAQEEYGLRCLLVLARGPEKFLSIEEVAGREGLTHAYVAKLMRALRRAGLVTSVLGKHGGYRLARAAEDTPLDAVIGGLGGRLFSSNFCQQHSGQSHVCIHDGDCSIRPFLIGLDAVIQRALGQVTLRDLVSTEHGMGSWVEAHLGAGGSTVGSGSTVAESSRLTLRRVPS